MSIPVLVVDASSHLDGEGTVKHLHHPSDDSLEASMTSHQGGASSLGEMVVREKTGFQTQINLWRIFLQMKLTEGVGCTLSSDKKATPCRD